MNNPQFVKLTDLDDGNPLWINPQHVIAVTTDRQGTWVQVETGSGWNVKESVGQTLFILTNGLNQAAL